MIFDILIGLKSSKKRRKGTKAQKAKQQQEEEERRLREEEEARLQAEREEQERLEREKREKELESLELKDQERRDGELNELCHLLEENHIAVTKWKTEAAETAKWQKYLHCDAEPDPTVQQEMNTFISLWRDSKEVVVTSVLKECKLVLQLVDELRGLLSEAADPQEGQKAQEALMNLQELLHFKHLQTTEDILKTANRHVDTETGNMQTVIQDDNVTLCLWANLSKNPRFKGLTFKEVGLGFELPKQLAVSSVAVRILHTRYDHLSLVSRVTHMTTRTSSSRSLVGSEAVSEEVDSSEPKENEEAKENSDERQQTVEEEVQSEGRKSAASAQSRKSSAQSAEGKKSQIETQMEALGAGEDLLSSSVQLGPRHGGDPVVDLNRFSPLGGVFFYDVFHLPPQAHQLLHTGLEEFPYPSEQPGSDGDGAPVGASVKLPDTVIFLQTPQVARWDPAGKQWRTDGIADVCHEEAEARVSFKMDSFQAFVLMQETHANLPFQKWELRPLGQNSALLTISGALLDLSITVQDNQCMLQSEQERGPAHLLGRWMSCAALQKAMLDAGVNIFVSEFTDKYVINCGKDPLTEHTAYEQMALFASACAFSWSRWNAKCGAEHLVLQACEHRGPDPVPQDSWSLYLLGAQRTQKLQITEASEVFSPDHRPGSEFHSTFIHMLQDDMSPEGVAITRTSHHLFVHTVQSLLCSTRLLMYAQ
ncbi:dynein axonemal intermediate chain 7 [Salarias fasciatus]|uniref:dynein axonemal intermediate chain 7 n=1 Tax=Salarias fasciatus TaxID=181472 RepID=UPI0011769FD5|nr:protein CASC1 [Salarias fasciatus]